MQTRDEIKAKQRAYHQLNKNEINLKRRAYYQLNKERVRRQLNESKARRRESIRISARKYYYEHREERLEYNRVNAERKAARGKINRNALKTEVLAHYGYKGKCECVSCAENDLRVLTIDHINGGGAEHRKQISGDSRHGSGGGGRTYKWLKINNFPTGFRTLCFNCQIKKENW